jgi:3-oxoadipate enol-lactonase
MFTKSFLAVAVFLLIGFVGALPSSAQSPGAAQTPTSATKEPMKVESGYVEVEGGKLYYEVAGEGKPFVMLHDGLLHRETWDGQFPVFAALYKVVRYDRRGYGLSSTPEARYSNIEDLNAVLEHLGIERATLMGMSAGGGLCLDFALEYPDKVDTIILVGAVVSGLGYTEHFLTRGGRLTQGALADPARALEYWAMEDPYEIAPQNTAAQAKVKALLEANPQNLDDAKHRLRQAPPRPALPSLYEISVPTLVIVGEYDIPDVHAHGGALEARVPGARREIVPGAGHLVPLERPDEFNRVVLAFLRDQSFFSILESGGVEAAVRAFEEARKAKPDQVPFGEGRMNYAGYQYLQDGRLEEAIELFKLNVLAYPESWNVYDSLGEAYLAAGMVDLARENYEKSLELNPGNANAARVLESLEAEE